MLEKYRGVFGAVAVLVLLQVIHPTNAAGDDATNGTSNGNSTVKPRQEEIHDKGYENCGAGWFDVQDNGAENDYCRSGE